MGLKQIDLTNMELRDLVQQLPGCDGDREIIDKMEGEAVQERKYGRIEPYSLTVTAVHAIGRNQRIVKRHWADVESIKETLLKKHTSSVESPEGLAEIPKNHKNYQKFIEEWSAVLRKETTMEIYQFSEKDLYVKSADGKELPPEKLRQLPPSLIAVVSYFMVD
jgi:hypothetical protein